MLYVFYCTDNDDGLEIRKRTRERHLTYLADLKDKIVVAGPFIDEETNSPIGSMIMVECENINDAKQIADNDPYSKAGLFKNVDIRAYKWLLGEGKK